MEMDKKKLVYNVLQDIWKVVQMEEANKPQASMTDDDWHTLIASLTDKSKKYSALSDPEMAFSSEVFMAFMNLIEREEKQMYREYTEKGSPVWKTA